MEEVRVEKLAESVTVYNLEVEDLHVYYVAGVLVHNTCGRDDFYKDEAEDSVDDFISLHSYNRHRYNADIKSTAKKTQYGKNINVRKLCEDTILNPDEVVYDSEQNVIKFSKEYNFNISTPDTPTGSHRVFIPLTHGQNGGKKNVRMSQFPFYRGD